MRQKCRKYYVIFLMCICGSVSVFAQSNSQAIFNEASRLYIENNAKEALRLTNRGLELYENDKSLLTLQQLLVKKDDSSNQNKNQNLQNQQDSGNDSNDDGAGEDSESNQSNKQQDSKQNQSGKNQSQADNKEQSSGNNSNNEQSQKNQQNADNDVQEGKDSQSESAKKSDKPLDDGRRKGHISSNEAEMLLRALENNERDVQIRLQEQKKQNQKRQTIDKNW